MGEKDFGSEFEHGGVGEHVWLVEETLNEELVFLIVPYNAVRVFGLAESADNGIGLLSKALAVVY